MVNKDYITAGIAGRMGNNMFIIANAYARALDFNKQFVIYKEHVKQGSYDYSQNIFRKIDFIDVWDVNDNFNPPVASDDKHTIYIGYYQSEKYFEKYSEAVKSLFSAPYDFIKRIERELPFLFSGIVTVISVRKGQDYIDKKDFHPTITKEYIYEAIKRLPHTDSYIVLSDNMDWCISNIGLENAYFLDKYQPHEQMWIMSLCHHFVISNSSFSWWGAYLSRYKEKVVVAPETWFGPSGPKDWNDMYCKDWIVLPTYFQNGLIYPK